MSLLKAIKNKIMARIEYTPIPKDDQMAALKAIAEYKKQNPMKYEQKKEALFARYGLDVEDEPEEVKDVNDLELEVIAKKVTKKATKK
jgi:hypothetical protein